MLSFHERTTPDDTRWKENNTMCFILQHLSIYFSEVEEFCQTETFTADCGSDAIVMIRSARYGRMKLGRCVQTDYGNVGCNVDVLAVTDRMCSGRHICHISVPHAEFDALRPCPGEFKTYLEISYTCVPGKLTLYIG